MIVPMAPGHVRQVARLHHHYIPSLLGDLGEPLCRAFYRQALRSDNCIGLVDECEGKLRGFAIGALDNSRLFSGWRIRLALLAALLRRPRLIRRLGFHLKGELASAPEILYEAVAPAWRRQGVASALTLALAEAFRARGVTHYEIRIDRDNAPNLSRHRKLGARVVREFQENGIARVLLDMRCEMR